MNSKELKRTFPEIYEEFFSSCSKVVSAPHVFFWTGDFSNFYGGLAVCSKIPLRLYVGFEKTSDDDLRIQEDFQAYFSSTKRFEKMKLDEAIVANLKKLLIKDVKGCRIKILSELPLGSSLGGLGAISACLAKLVFPNLQEEKAIKFSRALQRGRKSAATALCCMTESGYPILYTQADGKPEVKSIDSFLRLPKNVLWPIDFGLIYSGKLVRGDAVISSAQEMQEISQNLQSEASEILGSYENSLWDDYLKIMDHVSCQCLVGMKKMFQFSREKDIAYLFSTMNQYQNLLYFLGISTPTINKIYSSVHKETNYVDNGVGSGCKVTGVGRGGDVLFATVYGEARGRIERVIERVSRLNGQISLDYASWIDGIEVRGIVIEQDLDNNNFSSLLKKNPILFEVFEGKGKQKKIIKLRKNALNKVDLLLDLDSKKIFYKGKQVNSKKILSQKTTVEILDKLIRTKNLQISNKQIPSCYGKSRFDLQGKIIVPLEKLTGLSFDINGKMFDNFNLKLKRLEISVGTIRGIS